MTWSIRRIAMIGAAVAVAIVLVWYFALWHPQQAKVASAHKANAAAELQVDQLRARSVGLDALKPKIPADKATLAQLDAAVPRAPQLDTLLDEINGAEAQSGVTLNVLTPSVLPSAATSAGSPSLPTVGLTISFRGTSSQALSFVTDLEAQPRLMTVDTLSLSGTGTVTGQVTTRVFFQQ